MILLRGCPLSIVILLVSAVGCTMVHRDAAAPSSAQAPAPPAASAASAPAKAPPAPATTSPAGASSRPALTEDSTADDYVAFAEAANPGLQAAHARWQAAQQRAPQARSLDDPKLSYTAAVSKDMRIHEVTVEQMFPWFGKLDLRAAVAEEEANAARQTYEAQRVKLAYQVKQAYYEYYYLSRSIEAVRGNRDLVKYLGDVALAKYRTAGASQPDVIRAQVELGKLDDQLRTLEDSRGAAAARLNALLVRPMDTPTPWPKAVPEEKFDVPDPEILAWLHESNPELKGLDHEIVREKQAIALAEKDYYPDIGIGIGYMNNVERMEGSDDHMVVGMISVTLPIWREKYAAGVREAQLRHEAALKMRGDRENMLAADLKMATFGLRDATRKTALYRDTLLPKARESLQSVEAAFRTGSANFVDLVDARRTLLEFQLMYERSLVDHAVRLAEIEMLVGRPLPRKGEALPSK